MSDKETSSEAVTLSKSGDIDIIQSIFRAAPVGIGMVKERIIIEANDMLCTMTGYCRNELIGQSARLLYPTETEYDYVGEEKYRQISVNGNGTVETRWKKKNGEIIDIILSSSAIDCNDLSAGVTFTALDISDRIKYSVLKERVDKLDSLAMISGSIAHEFNNIFGGIFGYVEMARNSIKQGDTTREYLDNVMKVFDRSKALTGMLLTFAKGGEQVRKTGSIAQTLIETVRSVMEDTGHTYNFKFPKDLLLCEFDSAQISRTFRNIILNAMEAMPAGGNIIFSAENITITGMMKSVLKPGVYVKISISDNGPGIPVENIPRIFDPYFTTKNRSRGMGLASSHAIVTGHNGCIDVESNPGSGTSFHIYIPANEESVDDQYLEGIRNCIKNRCIILMDDEIFIRETVGEMLRIMGYEVCKVSDGEQVLSAIHEGLKRGTGFCAAILDLTVHKGIGGKETLRRMRELGYTIPVFATSGYYNDPAIMSPKDFGFTDSLRKPYRMEDLASLLNFYLNTTAAVS